MIGNAKISAAEEEVLQGEVVIKAESAERHHAMVNFLAHHACLYARHVVLAVDGLDVR